MPLPSSPSHALNPWASIQFGARDFDQAIDNFKPLFPDAVEGVYDHFPGLTPAEALYAVLDHFPAVTTRVWLNTLMAEDYNNNTNLGNEAMVIGVYGPKTTGGGSVVETCGFAGSLIADEAVRVGASLLGLPGFIDALAAAPSDSGVISILLPLTGVNAGKWDVSFTP